MYLIFLVINNMNDFNFNYQIIKSYSTRYLCALYEHVFVYVSDWQTVIIDSVIMRRLTIHNCNFILTIIISLKFMPR